MHDLPIAKVLALKAYMVGKQARSEEIANVRAKAGYAVNSLQEGTTVESCRRKVFYNLILAELARDADPVPYREADADAGERLEAAGCTNPVPIYMKIVDATTSRVNTADFGDFKSGGNWHPEARFQVPFGDPAPTPDLGTAMHAAGVDEEMHARFWTFLAVQRG